MKSFHVSSRSSRAVLGCIAGTLLAFACASPAFAGPPMICQEISIGDAKSLPWEGGRGGSDARYDAARLVTDTVSLLEKTPSPMVRMETLRRAAVYLSYDEDIARREARAWELLARLLDRVAASGANGSPSSDSLFDAGYLIGCYSQVDLNVGTALGEKDGMPGYAYIARAISISESAGKRDGSAFAEMNFGAALVAHPAMRARGRAISTNDRATFDAHIRVAAAGSRAGSILEKNLDAHLKHWGESLEAVRSEKASARPGAAKIERHQHADNSATRETVGGGVVDTGTRR